MPRKKKSRGKAALKPKGNPEAHSEALLSPDHSSSMSQMQESAGGKKKDAQFSPFKRLPLEIQGAIWDMVVAETPMPYIHFFMLVNASANPDNVDPTLMCDARSGNKHHSLLKMTCSEARRAVLRAEARHRKRTAAPQNGNGASENPCRTINISVYKSVEDDTEALGNLSGIGLAMSSVQVNATADLVCFDDPSPGPETVEDLLSFANSGLPFDVLGIEKLALHYEVMRGPRRRSQLPFCGLCNRRRCFGFCNHCIIPFLKRFIRLQSIYLVIPELPVPEAVLAAIQEGKYGGALPSGQGAIRWPEERLVRAGNPVVPGPYEVFWASDRMYYEVSRDSDEVKGIARELDGFMDSLGRRSPPPTALFGFAQLLPSPNFQGKIRLLSWVPWTS